MTRKKGVPGLNRHKSRQQGYVKLNGKLIYLGKWPDGLESPPKQVKQAYDREIAEWLQRGRLPEIPTSINNPQTCENQLPPASLPTVITVAEVITRWWKHIEQYYRTPDGKPTGELDPCRLALRPLNYLYGTLPAADFSPLKLKAVRELMVKGYKHPELGSQQPLTRTGTNARIKRICRMFRWAVAEELVPVSVADALRSVPGLRKGRCEARESDPVKPVADQVIEATLGYLQPSAAGLVQLQKLTGCRSGELLPLRLADIQREGSLWVYRPSFHKTQHHGRERIILFGPRAQAILLDRIVMKCPICGITGRPARIGSKDAILCGPCADRSIEQGCHGPWQRIEEHDPQAFLFSPRLDREESFVDKRKNRKTKVQPSQRCRKKAFPKREPGLCYDNFSYRRAIARAAKKAGVEDWHPHQLRHSHATTVRKMFGLEAAQIALGHSQANVTQIYAERDLTRAEQIARELG